MASEFVDIQKNIHQAQRELVSQQAMYAQVNADDFNPSLAMPFKNSSRFEITAEEVLQDVTTEALADEAIIQLGFVDSCFDRLKTAMIIIEAQSALALRREYKEDVQSIKSCLEQDHEAVRKGFDQIYALRSYQKEKSFPVIVQEDSFAKSLSDVTTQYRAINKGKLSLKFNVQLSPNELLEKIFEQRIDYGLIASEDLLDTLDKTRAALRDATYLKIAINENAIPSSPFIQKMIRQKLDYAGGRHVDAHRVLGTIQDYMADLYEMGEGNYGRKAFDVRRYIPVTIDGLDQLSP